MTAPPFDPDAYRRDVIDAAARAGISPALVHAIRRRTRRRLLSGIPTGRVLASLAARGWSLAEAVATLRAGGIDVRDGDAAYIYGPDTPEGGPPQAELSPRLWAWLNKARQESKIFRGQLV